MAVVAGTSAPMVWMSRITKIGKGEREFGSGKACGDHADWMGRASRILGEDGRAERGVGPWIRIGCKEAAERGMGRW